MAEPGGARTREHQGLHAPQSTALRQVEHRRRSPLRISVQIVGLIVGLGLLVWVCRLAFTGENRENLDRLLDAGWRPALGLLALQTASIAVGAIPFWTTLLPRRRMNLLDLVAVNALATMLSPLPFKISVLSRVLVHRRFDGMRFVEIAAWFVGLTATLVCMLGSVALASIIAGDVNALWFAIAGAGVGGGGTVILLGARFVRARPRLDKWTLESAELLCHPWPIVGTFAARTVDVTLYAGRFWIASAVLGDPLSAGGALLAASVYVLTGVIAPAGTLGAREGAVAGLALFPVGLEPSAIAAASLVVTGGEIAASIPLGLLGAWRLRAWRLLGRPISPPAAASGASAPGSAD
ncbi:MAG: hypothetical protein ACF8QF_12415 [Phycisphaerales bacterium]